MKKELKRYILTSILLLIVVFGIGCTASQFTQTVTGDEKFLFPIAKGMYGVGGTWDFLVYPMALLINFISVNIVNYNYALTILIATILVRSLFWPIYGKTNDMSLKMRIMAPEQAEIEARYKDKTDQESLRRKQMEVMQLYKKYKINFFGCLMPLLQMPIFFAFYETLRRIPFTTIEFLNKINHTLYDKKGVEYVVDELFVDFSNLKTTLFGIDLMKTSSEGGAWQRWGVYLLAFIVAITQLSIQIYSQARAKKQAEKIENETPSYRRPQKTDQQKQTESMMKIMLYIMPVMMIVFCVTSSAALAWYWVVGNIFTFTQTLIGAKTSEKKLNKLREKFMNEKEYNLTRRY